MAQVAKKIEPTRFEPEMAERSREILALIAAGLDSLEPAVIRNVVTNLVRLGEIGAEFNRPEVLELLREAARNSDDLRTLLNEIRELQEAGTISALLELGKMVRAVKDSLTPGIVTGVLQQFVNAVSILDQVQMFQGDRLATGMLTALQEAIAEHKDKPPQGLFGLMRQMNQPEARKGLSIFTAFLRKLPLQLGYGQ